MGIILIIVYVIVCLFLVMVVLLQQGKGADLAGAFGGGGSQASFGPRSATNIMHRMTTVSFVLFVVLSMTLAIMSGKARTSAMEDVATPVPVPATEVQTGGTDGTEMKKDEEKPAELPADAHAVQPKADGEANAPAPAEDAPAENAPENPAPETPADNG